METINALGVKIAALSPKQVFGLIEKYLLSSTYHQIATVNPDFIMEARHNQKFQAVLNTAHLALADGVGIYLPAFLQGKHLPSRIPGVDLTEYILARAEKNKLAVFLFARKDGLSRVAETKKAILKKYPTLRVNGYDVDIHSPADVARARNKVRGQVVFANFGAPFQDIFLRELRNVPGNTLRLAMGVGGTFDFFTGKQKRAPQFFRTAGLEWLWRLLLQPVRRSKRTFNYVVVYSLLCFREALMGFRGLEKNSRPLFARNMAKLSVFFGFFD